ncbi:MAG: lipoate--protein ligase [Clostridiales Family XIII bacterium]|jgi:lipoate-protein ligase A|nr:lipoate--protein ligase [Clostridiales Family XIII bacterium]
MEYYESGSTDPHFNLALEDHLFSGMDPEKDYLMLWQNANAVIVGRFQNTAAELNAGFIRDNKIDVVRRLSGGGAVYHDLGNLNYTFIRRGREAKVFDFSFFTKPLIDTLAAYGVKAELSGRNDVTVYGRKISGNAQYGKAGRVMHHGTILLSSDLTVLANALRVSGDKIQGKGISSVRSRVANLDEFIDGVTVDGFKSAFIEQLDRTESVHKRDFTGEDIARATKLQREKYDLWEWNYGSSPPYTVEKTRRIENFGRIELYLRIEKGRLVSFHSHGDYFGNEDLSALVSRLHGCRMEESALREALRGIDVGDFYRNLSNDAFISLMVD